MCSKTMKVVYALYREKEEGISNIYFAEKPDSINFENMSPGIQNIIIIFNPKLQTFAKFFFVTLCWDQFRLCASHNGYYWHRIVLKY